MHPALKKLPPFKSTLTPNQRAEFEALTPDQRKEFIDVMVMGMMIRELPQEGDKNLPSTD